MKKKGLSIFWENPNKLLFLPNYWSHVQSSKSILFDSSDLESG